MKFLDSNVNPKQLSPLTLAFVGDAVYELFVRQQLVDEANRPVNQLHHAAVRRVKAAAQARDIRGIMERLTEEETAVFKRGRNAHANHTPKNADEGDYHYATGLEAVFGYVYLQGNLTRLRELFYMILENAE